MISHFITCLIFCWSLLAVASGAPTPGCPAFRSLDEAHAMDRARLFEENRAELETRRAHLKKLQDEIAFLRKTFLPGGPLAHGGTLAILAALHQRGIALHQPGLSAARYALAIAHETLQKIFTGLDLAPRADADVDAQVARWATAADEFRKLVWSGFGESKRGTWPDLNEFRALAETLVPYLEGKPDLDRVADYFLNVRKLRTPWDGAIAAGGIVISPTREAPLMRTRRGAFGRERGGAEHYAGPDREQLASLQARARVESEAIERLTGGSLVEQASDPTQRYVPSASVVEVIGDSTRDTFRGLLTIRENLARRYFDGGVFFGGPRGKAVLDGTQSLEEVWRDYAPSLVPDAQADGNYDPAALKTFHAHVARLGLETETFIRHHNELLPFFHDPKLREDLAWLIRDRRDGGKQLAALRLLAAAPPAPAMPPRAQASAPESVGAPYEPPATELNQFNVALLTLARETASRGNVARPEQIAAGVLKAAEGIRRPMRAGTLTRAQAIDALSPAIDAAVAKTRALSLDFAHLRHDLATVRDRLAARQRDLAERHRSLELLAAEGTTVHPVDLEDVAMLADDLSHQLLRADALASVMTTLRSGIKAQREAMDAMQSQLYFPDPARTNHLDTKRLEELLDALAKN